MKSVMMCVVALGVFPLFAQWGTTTYYNGNGSYGGSARTTQLGNTTQTTYYNSNGSYGGRSQTTTTHYNQYGQPIGTSTQYR